jgi:tetratricopeptide (TPR) repeat protein
MDQTCNVCGIHATEGQSFEVESLPFLGGRNYCPNCHARLLRRFFQVGLVLDVALGLLGLGLVLHDPASRLGHCVLNLFLVQLFLVGATVPHELAHALAARWCGWRVGRIIIGFGPPVWAGRCLGFEVELRRIPYSGCTESHAPKGRSQLWRHVFVFAAGPLLTIALAGFGRMAAGGTAESVTWTTYVSPWWLFYLANATIAVQHLFPYVGSTPFGRMPSDGLALWQALVQRRVPGVASEKAAAPVPEINFARQFARRFSVAVFGTGAAVCLTCAVFVGRAAIGSSAAVPLWMAAGLFAALGGTFAWGAVWVQRKPWQSSAGPGLPKLIRHSEVTLAFRAEINARSFWPPDLDYDQVLAFVREAQQSGDLTSAAVFLDDAIRWAPDNVALLGWRGMVLAELGQHEEARAQFAAVLESADLGLSIRVTFLAEQIKAWLRLGQRQRAWMLCGSYLDEPSLLPEKLYLLDTLAALAVQEARSELLPDADHWSAQALSMQPENLSLKATRGAVLAERTRWDEALPLLTEVLHRSEIQEDQGLAAFFLALAAEQRGDVKAAGRFARQARLMKPPRWIAQRLDATQPGRRRAA